MATTPPPGPPGSPPPPDEDQYAPPPELDGEHEGSTTGRRAALGRGPGRRGGLVAAVIAAVAVVAAGALFAYRAHHASRTVREARARAEALLRLDTAPGYREAAGFLDPLVQLDPMELGSMRAFALAMLSADYREEGAATEAEDLLRKPGGAPEVPVWANLAAAAVYLGRGTVGDAVSAAAPAGDAPLGLALQGRLALVAGNPAAAVDTARAAAVADPGLAMAQAVLGDAVRRSGGDPAGARAAYRAALAASPRHPRATYGLAKLALASRVPAGEAVEPLQDLLADAERTPAPERARAALHLAALRLRAGDRSGAERALDAAQLGGPARAWAGRAAAVLAEERRSYRAVRGAPPDVTSPSDDDPGELWPVPPEPPVPPPAARPGPAKKPAAKATASKKPGSRTAAKPASRTATSKKSTAPKPPAKKPAAKPASTPATTR